MILYILWLVFVTDGSLFPVQVWYISINTNTNTNTNLMLCVSISVSISMCICGDLGTLSQIVGYEILCSIFSVCGLYNSILCLHVYKSFKALKLVLSHSISLGGFNAIRNHDMKWWILSDGWYKVSIDTKTFDEHVTDNLGLYVCSMFACEWVFIQSDTLWDTKAIG